MEPTRKVDVYERVMLALRTADGLDLRALKEEYGLAVQAAVITSLQPFTGPEYPTPLVQFTAEDVDLERSWRRVHKGRWLSVRLTSPEGFILSNDVISTVFAALNHLTQNDSE